MTTEDDLSRKLRQCFTVDLVDAKTKTSFLRHEKNGKIYIEAEPDAGFLIRVNKVKELPRGTNVFLSAYLDGKNLDWAVRFDDIKSFLFGFRHHHGNADHKNKMRFRKYGNRRTRNVPLRRSARKGTNHYRKKKELSHLMGKVEVRVYENLGHETTTAPKKTSRPTKKSSKKSHPKKSTSATTSFGGERFDAFIVDEKWVTAEEGSIYEETVSTDEDKSTGEEDGQDEEDEKDE